MQSGLAAPERSRSGALARQQACGGWARTTGSASDPPCSAAPACGLRTCRSTFTRRGSWRGAGCAGWDQCYVTHEERRWHYAPSPGTRRQCCGATGTHQHLRRVVPAQRLPRVDPKLPCRPGLLVVGGGCPRRVQCCRGALGAGADAPPARAGSEFQRDNHVMESRARQSIGPTASISPGVGAADMKEHRVASWGCHGRCGQTPRLFKHQKRQTGRRGELGAKSRARSTGTSSRTPNCSTVGKEVGQQLTQGPCASPGGSRHRHDAIRAALGACGSSQWRPAAMSRYVCPAGRRQRAASLWLTTHGTCQHGCVCSGSWEAVFVP